jgi:histidine triad (HIT) family protein
MECIFCSIAKKNTQTSILYENEDCIAFKDIMPKAPTHILIIPKEHIRNLLEIKENNGKLTENLFNTVKVLVSKFNLENTGFRVVVNTGEDGGQTVDHLHLHLLAGRKLNWPPG